MKLQTPPSLKSVHMKSGVVSIQQVELSEKKNSILSWATVPLPDLSFKTMTYKPRKWGSKVINLYLADFRYFLEGVYNLRLKKLKLLC